MNILSNELSQHYEQVAPMDFYSAIFNDDLTHNELSSEVGKRDKNLTWEENQARYEKGRYMAIAHRISTFSDPDPKKRTKVKPFYIFNGLDVIDELYWSDKQLEENEVRRLTILSPVSYKGKRRLNENARFLYALVVEIDHLRVTGNKQTGLADLIHQMEVGHLPKATYIVASGNGIHLYYKFVKPIPCFDNVKESLERYKRALTKKLWNKLITNDYQEEKIQYQSVFQGFRMVGTRTKSGDQCDAFAFGDQVSIEYMNRFVAKKNHMVEIYQSDLLLARAKELYPEWYEKRIVKGEKSHGHWICNRALYDWWKNRLQDEVVVGHRYYSIVCLTIYAMKCDIPFEELQQDAYSFVERFDSLTVDEDNHFSEQDVESAICMYHTTRKRIEKNDKLFTYPISYIEKRSGLTIPRNKRNGRTQEKHLQGARAIRDINNDNWRAGNGRKPLQSKIQQWRIDHPDGRKCDCIRDLGIDKKTCYKWWDVPILNVNKSE